MVLRKLADDASRYLGEPVTGAVITVPAALIPSDKQRGMQGAGLENADSQ